MERRPPSQMEGGKKKKKAFKGPLSANLFYFMAAYTHVRAHVHVDRRYESYSTRGLYIIPLTGVSMYFRTWGIVGGKGKDRTGDERSHFQVGFRTARPLEGTSNDSDIAAREFKSLTPSGSLSLYACLPFSTTSSSSIHLSLSICSIDELDLRLERGKKKKKKNKIKPGIFRIFHPTFFLSSSDKIFSPRSLDILSIRADPYLSRSTIGRKIFAKTVYRYFPRAISLEIGRCQLKIFSDPWWWETKVERWIEFPKRWPLLSRPKSHSVVAREAGFRNS